ncbi:MAG: polysaccharide deacetylase family protein [Pirellulales bacterium]|nr:polysaccharide deacetylase family protein [Pirellulales bacterium]
MPIKPLAKSVLFSAARHLGGNALWRRMSRNRPLMLCYHGVVSDDYRGDAYRSRGVIFRRVFREQLETLARFCNPISARDLLAWKQGEAELPPRPVLITFDDGYRNVLTNALPELTRLGIPALINVTTGHIGEARVLWPQELDERILGWKSKMLPLPENGSEIVLPADTVARAGVAARVRAVCKRIPNGLRGSYLERLRGDPLPCDQEWFHELYDFSTWEEVRKQHRQGFEIGSHTVSHPILTRLAPDEVDTELRRSKATIERELGAECPWIAYPNGGPADVSEEIARRAKEAGYKIGLTLIERPNTPATDPLLFHRLCVLGNLPVNVFHAKISGLYWHAKRFLDDSTDVCA